MSERLYRRELNHSYLVFRSNDREISGSYAYRMMERNRIGRLLACSLRQMDGETWLYYDISSRQPLERLYEGRKLGVSELERLVRGILTMQEELSRYLLDVEGLLLEADTIFADVETEELYFCFLPGCMDTADRYSGLADYLLEHVDHGEEHAVNIAYQFYKQSKAAYFVLASFLPFLEKEAAAYRKGKADSGESGWKETGADVAYIREELPDMEAGTAEPDTAAGGQEKTGFSEQNGKKFGLFSWLRRKRAKREETETEEKAYWQDTILDSYLGQMEMAGAGETVYLADLDQISGRTDGIPVLQEEEGERRFLLENLPVTVGKLKDRAGILLSDRSVSRVHACFEAGEEGICVRDLNSRNGTIVNGKKLQPNETVCLQNKDLIQFGRERFRYELKRH